MMARVLTVSMMLLLAACPKSGTEPRSEPAAKTEGGAVALIDAKVAADERAPARTAKDVVLDGFRLGDSYAELMAREPYQNPCDDDPVDAEKTTRAMVYGALPCRKQTFADGTTLLVFLPFEDPDVFDKPIEAVVWLGGSYFNERGNFGLDIGADRATVREKLGKAIGSFMILDRVELAVEFYDGDQFAIFDGDVAAGYAIGSLPKKVSANDGHWMGVAQMYRRYTTRVAAPRSEVERRANCEKLITKAIGLMRAESKHTAEADELAANREVAIGKCVKKINEEGFRCSMAAQTYDEFGVCYRKHKR